jgi:hypothetical protein
MALEDSRASTQQNGEELSPAVAELLEDYAQDEAPSERLRRRMLRELNHSVESGVEPLFPADDVDPTGSGPHRRGRRAAWGVAAIALAAGVAALAWSGYDASAGSSVDRQPNAAQDLVDRQSTTHDATMRNVSKGERRSPATAPIVSPEQPEQPEPEPEPLPELADEAPPPVTQRTKRSRSGKSKSDAPGDSEPRPSSRLDEEAASLAAARRALNQGNHASALKRLRGHEKRFANGLLAQEREVLFVQALCKAGKHAAAKKRAAKFKKRFPNSPHAATVSETCDP